MKKREMEGVVVSKNELVILLNELFLDNTNLNLSFPFYNLHLMTLKPKEDGYIVSNPVDKISFKNARRKHLPNGSFFERDAPVFNDVREAYVVSGMIPYPNIDEIQEIFYDLMVMGERSMRSIFLAPDTNIAYLRFFTGNFPLLYGNFEISIDKFRFVISELVQRELDNMIEEKYTGEQIRKMAERYSHSYLIEGFYNASTKKSRRAKDALVEFHTLRRLYGALTTQAPEFVKDKEVRDRLIADSYYEFQKRENAFVVVVSADEDMIAHVIERDMDHIFVKYPSEYVPDRSPKSPWAVVNLIYTLALRMGAITEENYGIDIAGEWYGKDNDAYNRQMVKIFFNGATKIEKQFNQSLNIARKLSTIIGGKK